MYNMLEFLLTTLSIALGIVLASLISMVALFAIMCNPKVMAFITNKYMNALEKASDYITDQDEENEEL